VDQIRDAHKFAAIGRIYRRHHLIPLDGGGVVPVGFGYSRYEGNDTFAHQIGEN
jgi:hypothetical protein